MNGVVDAFASSRDRNSGPITTGSREQSGPAGHWIGAITLLGLALRLFRLGHQSLSVDEVGTFYSSVGSLYDVLTQTEVNTHIPPFYNVLAKGTLVFGSGEAWLRLPSAVAGILSIPILFLVVRAWAGTRLAVASALLVAVSPFHIWYSQEARSYALFLLLALLSVWCFQQIREKPRHVGWNAGFVGATAAAFYTHTVAVGLFALLGLFVLTSVPWREWKRWVLPGVSVAVLISAGVYRLSVAPATVVSAGSGSEAFNISHLGYAIWTFVTGYSLGPSSAELHDRNPGRVALQYTHVIAPVLLLYSGLAMAGVLHLWRHRRHGLYMLLLWLLVPLATALLGAIVTKHVFHVRYAILAFPPAAALIAAGIVSVRPQMVRAATWSLVLLVTGFSLANHYFNPKYHREDVRAAAAFVSSEAQPGEAVIVSAPYMVRTVQHYLTRDDLRVMRYPDRGRPGIPGFPGPYLQSPDEDLASALERLGRGEGRYWLLLSRTFHSDREGRLTAESDRLFTRAADFSAPGVRAIRYSVD